MLILKEPNGKIKNNNFISSQAIAPYGFFFLYGDQVNRKKGSPSASLE